MKKTSEKRMYVLVPYNLSDIQKGIQAAHAGIEYAEMMNEPKTKKVAKQKYKDWVENWKTMIVLNGGTTNDNWEFPKFLGSLQRYEQDLKKLGVTMQRFRELDLNNATTAIAFVLDMEEDSHVLGYLKQMGLA